MKIKLEAKVDFEEITVPNKSEIQGYRRGFTSYTLNGNKISKNTFDVLLNVLENIAILDDE